MNLRKCLALALVCLTCAPIIQAGSRRAVPTTTTAHSQRGVFAIDSPPPSPPPSPRFQPRRLPHNAIDQDDFSFGRPRVSREVPSVESIISAERIVEGSLSKMSDRICHGTVNSFLYNPSQLKVDNPLYPGFANKNALAERRDTASQAMKLGPVVIDHVLRFLQVWTLDRNSAGTLKAVNGANLLFKLSSFRSLLKNPTVYSMVSDVPALISMGNDYQMMMNADKLSKLDRRYGKGKKFVLMLLGGITAALGAFIASNGYDESDNTDKAFVAAYAILNWFHRYFLSKAQYDRLKYLDKFTQIDEDIDADLADEIDDSDIIHIGADSTPEGVEAMDIDDDDEIITTAPNNDHTVTNNLDNSFDMDIDEFGDDNNF